MVLNAGLKSSPWIACRPVATSAGPHRRHRRRAPLHTRHRTAGHVGCDLALAPRRAGMAALVRPPRDQCEVLTPLQAEIWRIVGGLGKDHGFALAGTPAWT